MNSVPASSEARMSSHFWRLAPRRSAGMASLFERGQLGWTGASDRPLVTLPEQADQAAVAELEQLALAFVRQEKTGQAAQER
jgi:hypothetical protein